MYYKIYYFLDNEWLTLEQCIERGKTADEVGNAPWKTEVRVTDQAKPNIALGREA